MFVHDDIKYWASRMPIPYQCILIKILEVNLMKENYTFSNSSHFLFIKRGVNFLLFLLFDDGNKLFYFMTHDSSL